LMLASPWEVTSLQLSGHASPRFAKFGVHCRKMFSSWLSFTRWLFQLGSCRGAWSLGTTTAVSPKRCCSSSVVCPEEWTHNATPARASLAQNQGANPVPLVCSSVPLSERNCSIIPGRGPSFGSWLQQPWPMVYIIAGAKGAFRLLQWCTSPCDVVRCRLC
jgi:hypothetical protein